MAISRMQQNLTLRLSFFRKRTQVGDPPVDLVSGHDAHLREARFERWVRRPCNARSWRGLFRTHALVDHHSRGPLLHLRQSSCNYSLCKVVHMQCHVARWRRTLARSRRQDGRYGWRRFARHRSCGKTTTSWTCLRRSCLIHQAQWQMCWNSLRRNSLQRRCWWLLRWWLLWPRKQLWRRLIGVHDGLCIHG